jgi:high-affinity K+ transport system ATPase subunit B
MDVFWVVFWSPIQYGRKRKYARTTTAAVICSLIRVQSVIRQLKEMGIDTVMLTGDAEEVAQSVGKQVKWNKKDRERQTKRERERERLISLRVLELQVGITRVLANQLPQDKYKFVKALRREVLVSSHTNFAIASD